MAHAKTGLDDQRGAEQPDQMIQVFRLLRTDVSFRRGRQIRQQRLKRGMNMRIFPRRKICVRHLPTPLLASTR
jgi:hypothetical protein